MLVMNPVVVFVHAIYLLPCRWLLNLEHVGLAIKQQVQSDDGSVRITLARLHLLSKCSIVY